jgi:tRNA modification GTPase
MTPSPDTIAAIATPPGRGGIGVVRLSGGAVPAIAAALVTRPLVPRVATVATFRGARGEPLDQGLVLFFPAPHSYTGEHVLELHGHGGPAVLRLLLARSIELGARLAQPGEFTQRAFLNGKLDLAQAEAVADLIAAATTTAARAAARSLSGVFSDEIRALVDALIDLRMFTEATLDFPDEDIDFLRAADARGKLAALRARLAGVLDAARQGALLRDGLSVVLVGEPNVGKSSLINRLCGRDVAIVTAIPGTTRDAIASEIEISGIPLTVIDTAGLRPTDDPIETLGIERTWAAVRRADLALVLVDARAAGDGIGAPTAMILAQLPAALPRIIVHNKIDLCAGEAARVARVESGGADGDAPMRPRRHVRVSAKTGAGVEALRREMLLLAGAQEEMEGAFLARERHLFALREAERHLEAAARQLAQDTPPLELLAEELREAQTALAAITGEFTADDLLGVIFSRFCLGK